MSLSHWPIACLVFAAGLEIVLALLIAARLRLLAARPCVVALAFAAIWSIDYAFDLSTADFAAKLLLLRLRFLFIPFYSLLWFEAAFRFATNRRCLFGRRLALAAIVPVATSALTWLPPASAHPFFIGRFWLDRGGALPLLRFSFGPWAIVFFPYMYGFLIAAFAVLWLSLRGASWDRAARWLLLGALLCGAGMNALFALHLSPTPGLNYAPIFSPINCMLVMLAMTRGRMLRLGPVARAALIESLEEMLVVLDETDRIVDLNRAAAKALGRPPELAIGRPIEDVLGPWPEVGAALRGGGPKAELRVGGVVHEFKLIPVADRSDRVRARVLMLRDISDRKGIEEELKRAKEAAETADQAKSQFLATISHEIRTPMNAVVGFTHLLTGTPVSEEQRQYLEMIQQGGRGILVIIDDVLNYTKISSGRLELEEAPCRPAELASQACSLLQPRAKEKEVGLRWTVDPDVPQVVLGDPVRIGQILTNLVGNAVKFTERGQVDLRVSRNGPGGLAFTIADTGIGIAPEAMDRIFQPFSQADNSITRKFGGTGLGLAISKRLCELMGGDLTVASRLGLGTTFRAAIQVGVPRPRPQAAAPAPSLGPEDRKLNLLVCEDNRLNQRVIGALLAKMGHRFRFAETGEAGLDILARERFDAVLMDIEMPDMDGYETVRRLRRKEAGGPFHQRVIAVTAHAMDGIRERCLSAGMDDFLTKPIDPALLAAALRQCPAG